MLRAAAVVCHCSLALLSAAALLQLAFAPTLMAAVPTLMAAVPTLMAAVPTLMAAAPTLMAAAPTLRAAASLAAVWRIRKRPPQPGSQRNASQSGPQQTRSLVAGILPMILDSYRGTSQSIRLRAFTMHLEGLREKERREEVIHRGICCGGRRVSARRKSPLVGYRLVGSQRSGSQLKGTGVRRSGSVS